MRAWALIVAAGAGSRMGQGRNKVFLEVGGRTALERSVAAFSGLVDGTMIVGREDELAQIEALGLPAKVTAGGATRQQSVLLGLRALPKDAEIVLVHDAARPFVDAGTIERCIASVQARGSGVASVPVKDTIKVASVDERAVDSPARETLRIAQTPQGFRRRTLEQAIEALERQGITETDDAAAVQRAGYAVYLTEGDYANIKLTTPEDLQMTDGVPGRGLPRVGYGYDVHALVQGRPLVLCGIQVPHTMGLDGHSDADVATHALMDALLGAAAMGDIGRHFPDTDAQYRGADSTALLSRVVALLAGEGYAIGNVDITIAAQRPKLSPYIDAMRAALAERLGVTIGHVNVKATTTEGLGFEGEGLGISAHAVALIAKG